MKTLSSVQKVGFFVCLSVSCAVGAHAQQPPTMEKGGKPPKQESVYYSTSPVDLHDGIKVGALSIPGAEPVIEEGDAEFVAQAMILLPDGPFTSETWGTWTTAVKVATGNKGRQLFMPLRKALTGQTHGPDMASFMPLLQVVKARV